MEATIDRYEVEEGGFDRGYLRPSPRAGTLAYSRFDEARVLRAVDSLRAIQRFLDHGLPLDRSTDLDAMSKLVFDQNPKCLTRLFGMFVKKLSPPRPDCVNLSFSSFVWALCHMDQKSTAATLALLYGKCTKLQISGKGLKRIFKHVYGHSFKKKTTAQTLDQYATGLASEVIAYARGIADLTTGTLKCSAPHSIEAICDDCVIPVSTFVRFVCKSQRAVLWPLSMIQEHLRRSLFGERFWSGLRDLKPLFEDVNCISSTYFEAIAVNIFAVTRKLLQWHEIHKEAEHSSVSSPITSILLPSAEATLHPHAELNRSEMPTEVYPTRIELRGQGRRRQV